MEFSNQIFNTIQIFCWYFVELSLLFLGINVFVNYMNKRFSLSLQKHLGTKKISSYFKAMLLGSITPFCSCSTIPLFSSLIKNQIPLAIAFAYLLSSPLINPILIALFIISFGIKLSLIYALFIFAMVLILCLILSNFDSKNLIKQDFFESKQDENSVLKNIQIKPSNNKTEFKNIKFKSYNSSCCGSKNKFNSFKSYLNHSFNDYKKLLAYLILATSIGSLMHNFIPQDSLIFLNQYNYLGVIVAAFVGILLYIRIETIIPIALALLDNGLSLGVVMSLLIAGGGCSLPELILLKAMFKYKLLFFFVFMVLSIAISFGCVLI